MYESTQRFAVKTSAAPQLPRRPDRVVEEVGGQLAECRLVRRRRRGRLGKLGEAAAELAVLVDQDPDSPRRYVCDRGMVEQLNGNDGEVHVCSVLVQDAPLELPPDRRRFQERESRAAERRHPIVAHEQRGRIASEEDDVEVRPLVRRYVDSCPRADERGRADVLLAGGPFGYAPFELVTVVAREEASRTRARRDKRWRPHAR